MYLLGYSTILLWEPPNEVDSLRIAFDADAVLFSEESEAIYKREGLEAFLKHEHANADLPLPDGPHAKLLKKLSTLQRRFSPEDSLVRIAIVTARNSPAHERVIKTLRAWGAWVDAAFFLGGMPKAPVLKAFRAQIFFDDQEKHLAETSHHIPCALVPYRSHSPLRQTVDGSDCDVEPVEVVVPPDE